MNNWDDYYKESRVEDMPWYNPVLDENFRKSLEIMNIRHGKILDIGSGPGTQAYNLSKLGFEVTGMDISKTAIKNAREKYDNNNLNLHWVEDDILHTQIKSKFNLILDRGCFHVLEPDGRLLYIKNVKSLMSKKAYLFLKTFSHLEPGTQGPFRFKPSDIEKLFGSELKIINLEEAIFSGNRKPQPKAIFCILQKE